MKDAATEKNNALGKLATDMQSDLYHYFYRRIGNRAIAEEYVQDVFLRFTSGKYDPSAFEARPILFGIARHILLDYYRKNKQKQNVGFNIVELDALVMDTVPENTPSPEQKLLAREDLALVMAAIKGIPPKAKEVFLLARMHGLKHREIAENLGISKSMVEKHIMLAMATLLKATRAPEVK